MCAGESGQYVRFGDEPVSQDEIARGEFNCSLFFNALRDSVAKGAEALVLNFYSDKTALDAL